MYTKEILKDDLRELDSQIEAIRDKANPTPADVTKLNSLCDEVEKIDKELKATESKDDRLSVYRQEAKTANAFKPTIGYTSYRDLFGNNLSNDGFKSFGEFIGAILAGGGDRRLRWGGSESSIAVVGSKRAMAESPPSAGGFLVPTMFAADVLDVAVEDSIVLKRAAIWKMTAPTLKIPGWVIGDHTSNLYGGVTCAWENENATLTEANPKTRLIELHAHKLTAYTTSSNELRSDAPNYEERITGLIAKALGWYMDKSMLDPGSAGDGAGKCQSVLNSPALITISKETGQETGIVYENLIKMMARMFPPSFQRSVWVASISTIPSLMLLSVPVGTGGAHVPVMNEKSGAFSIFGRPVLFTEKVPALDSASDISLIDFSQYAVGLRGQMQIAASGHILFDQDKTAWRGIVRVDAQSSWDETLTPANCSTLSPVVTLGAR